MAEESREAEEHKEEEMPPDVRLLFYFITIMRTIFIFLILMLINVFFGLYLGFAIPEQSTPLRMILFYGWFVISLAAFLYVSWRMWRKKMPPP